MSVTEKVRLRGIVGETWVRFVEVAGGRGSVVSEEGQSRDGGMESGWAVSTEEDEGEEEMEVEGHHGRWEMEIARVYERTVVELGSSLDGDGERGFG